MRVNLNIKYSQNGQTDLNNFMVVGLTYGQIYQADLTAFIIWLIYESYDEIPISPS